MNDGFVILAQNTKNVNYVECAEALAMGMKQAMPTCDITLVSNDVSMCTAFDHVIELPYGDLAPNSDWKLVNDWQIYEASPYDRTIKLEADMFINTNIQHLFDLLSIKDICVCSHIRDYKGKISDSRVYRKFIDDNNLPDVYNAITFFKKNKIAENFFYTVKNIFEHWDEYKTILKCNSEEKVTTDWAYSIACHIMGVENTTIPNETFSMVHMKQYINNTLTEDWTNELVYELNDIIKIQTFPQCYPVHYHVKHFGKILKEHYGRI